MVFDWFVVGISLGALSVGSYTDLKTREVPDWLNYALVFAGFGIRMIFGAAEGEWSYLAEGAIGFVVLLLFALIMFYTGQWGGGDSKMMMGLGAVLGLGFRYDSFMLAFLANLLVVGSAYGIAWVAWLIIRNYGPFIKEFRKKTAGRSFVKLRRGLLIFGTMMLVAGLAANQISIKILLVLLAASLVFAAYLWIAIRSVEKVCMIKEASVSKLTEGDWIVEPVKHKNKIICGPKDLGISKEQIRQLKRIGIESVRIKEGIPFVPSFLLAYVFSLAFGNVFMVLAAAIL